MARPRKADATAPADAPVETPAAEEQTGTVTPAPVTAEAHQAEPSSAVVENTGASDEAKAEPVKQAETEPMTESADSVDDVTVTAVTGQLQNTTEHSIVNSDNVMSIGYDLSTDADMDAVRTWWSKASLGQTVGFSFKQEFSSLSASVSDAIKQASAEADHAKAGVLETLHLHASEFLQRLNSIEDRLEGDVLAAVQRIKSVL